MKVKLLTRKGTHDVGSVVEYDQVSARWLIDKGHAEAVKEKATADADKPAARRGRPAKAKDGDA